MGANADTVFGLGRLKGSSRDGSYFLFSRRLAHLTAARRWSCGAKNRKCEMSSLKNWGGGPGWGPGWHSSVDSVWPVTQKVTSSIPSQGTCLGCRLGPQLGACERKVIDVSLTH